MVSWETGHRDESTSLVNCLPNEVRHFSALHDAQRSKSKWHCGRHSVGWLLVMCVECLPTRLCSNRKRIAQWPINHRSVLIDKYVMLFHFQTTRAPARFFHESFVQGHNMARSRHAVDGDPWCKFICLNVVPSWSRTNATNVNGQPGLMCQVLCPPSLPPHRIHGPVEYDDFFETVATLEVQVDRFFWMVFHKDYCFSKSYNQQF